MVHSSPNMRAAHQLSGRALDVQSKSDTPGWWRGPGPVHGQLASGASLSQLTVQLDVVVRPQLT